MSKDLATFTNPLGEWKLGAQVGFGVEVQEILELGFGFGLITSHSVCPGSSCDLCLSFPMRGGVWCWCRNAVPYCETREVDV